MFLQVHLAYVQDFPSWFMPCLLLFFLPPLHTYQTIFHEALYSNIQMICWTGTCVLVLFYGQLKGGLVAKCSALAVVIGYCSPSQYFSQQAQRKHLETVPHQCKKTPSCMQELLLLNCSTPSDYLVIVTARLSLGQFTTGLLASVCLHSSYTGPSHR